MSKLYSRFTCSLKLETATNGKQQQKTPAKSERTSERETDRARLQGLAGHLLWYAEYMIDSIIWQGALTKGESMKKNHMW
jgi:hypothetical protein